VPKRMASDQDNFRNNNFRTLPLMPSHTWRQSWMLHFDFTSFQKRGRKQK
jgi:hypothetical protein